MRAHAHQHALFGMCRHKVRIFWGHREADAVLGGPCLELQRMAAVAGLSFWDPSSYLSLHPKYGPWFALRAVILFDGVEYTGEAQQQFWYQCMHD